jgi:hypothetical protein
MTWKPVAKYNGSPGNVETSSSARKPAARAATTHSLISRRPNPRRVQRVNEERPDARRFGTGVQQWIIYRLRLVSPEQRSSATPATAGDDPSVGFDHKVGAIGDELAIDAEDIPDGGFGLRGRVVPDAERARGTGDQGLQVRNVGGLSQAQTIHV